MHHLVLLGTDRRKKGLIFVNFFLTSETMRKQQTQRLSLIITVLMSHFKSLKKIQHLDKKLRSFKNKGNTSWIIMCRDEFRDYKDPQKGTV